MHPGKTDNPIVVSALSVRTGFGKLLRRMEDEHLSLVIEKRGTPKAVLLSIGDYVRLGAGARSVAGHRRRIEAQGHGQADLPSD